MKMDRFINFFRRRQGKKGIDWELIKEDSGGSIIASFLGGKGFSIHRLQAFFISTLAISMTIILLFCGSFGALEVRIFRSTILTFFLLLAFLVHPLGRKSWRDPLNVFFVLDVVLIFLTVGIQIYTYVDIDRFTWKLGELSFLETFSGFAEFFLILEASRRTMGLVFTGICFFFLIEPFFAHSLPSFFHGPSIDFEQMIEQQFMRDDGIFGIALGVMVNTISIFIIFGAFLQKTLTGQFFIALANSVAGKFRGGAAKIAVITSALFGTMSGSVVANVTVTGVVTIPMMQKGGYSKEYAGAVEAAASTGGQVLPPVMGVGAFLLAGILGVSYATVCYHAIIPAILYYVSLYFAIDFHAQKMNIQPFNKVDVPDPINVMRDGGYLFVPIGIIIYLLIKGFSPEKAVVLSLLFIFALSFFRHQTRLSPVKLLEAFEEGGRMMVQIGVACAAIGLIIGSVGASGLGTRFTSLVLQASGGHPWVALVFTMIAGIILGMGVPTSVVYILLAVLIVPLLIQLGFMPITAHLFVFYFGVIANITPPVAMAAMAASTLAKSNYMKTGFISMRIALPCYLVPFVFVYAPELILIGSVSKMIIAILSAAIGVCSMSAANEGWLVGRANFLERVLLFVAAIFLILPAMHSSFFGFLLFGIVFIMQLKTKRMFKVDYRVAKG